MAPRKQSAARAPLKPWDYGTPKIGPFDKSLDGQPPLVGNVAFVREQNHATNVSRLESLLAGVQSIKGLKPLETPAYEATEIEEPHERVEDARYELVRAIGKEAEDFDDARVWWELYVRMYASAEQLQDTVRKLEDALEEGSGDVDDHNNALDQLSAEARRLELDLGL